MGRSKEMIKVSGYSVFLAEIDAVLFQHPAIVEAVTVGVPHEYRGEEPKSYVVLASEFKEKISEAEIIEFCKKKWQRTSIPGTLSLWKIFLKAVPGKS